ncbi:MAG: hypothetical protein CMG07_00890 [Candidatus Marinimicrobia bacterium]|nr:hypothetical protein [Candidatus Neomarinimicrobiota bacterium]
MFNINFLGHPGIQPDIVNNYISYRAEDEKNIKNIVVKKEPGFFTKIIDYVPSTSDYLAFFIIVALITFFVFVKPQKKFVNSSKKIVFSSLAINIKDLDEKYSILNSILEDLKLQNDIKILKISTQNNYFNFKMFSPNFNKINEFQKILKNKYNLNFRIASDNKSNFILTTELPWKIYNDIEEKTKIQNIGESSFIIYTLQDLIKKQKLHKGTLGVDINKDGYYFIKFYSSNN